MNVRLVHLAGLLALLTGSGCGTIDVSSGNTARVVNGTLRGDLPLPGGAEIVVRMIETGGRPTPRAAPDLPLGDRAAPAAPVAERVLGEQVQTLAAPTSEPVPFRVAFEADDATLRRGLNLEVRVSAGGRVRFRTVNAHVVTLASSPFPQEVAVQSVER